MGHPVAHSDNLLTNTLFPFTFFISLLPCYLRFPPKYTTGTQIFVSVWFGGNLALDSDNSSYLCFEYFLIFHVSIVLLPSSPKQVI